MTNEETAPCTRCESEVEKATLISFGSWKLCEDCMGEM